MDRSSDPGLTLKIVSPRLKGKKYHFYRSASEYDELRTTTEHKRFAMEQIYLLNTVKCSILYLVTIHVKINYVLYLHQN